ncbi:MAG: HlyD family secretion protein [Byssovorax sp.]
MTASSPTADTVAPAPPAPAARPRSRSVVLGLLAAAAAAAVAGYTVLHRGLERTDDAQIDAETVSIPTRASGLVTAIHFSDNQQVKAGEVLAELDSAPAAARLAQAEANLEAASAGAEAADADARVAETNAVGNKSVAEASLAGASSSVAATRQQIAEGEAMVASAEANLQKVQLDLDRAKALVASGAVASAQLDQAQVARDTARAALDQARAHLTALRATTSQAQSRVQEASARVTQTSNVDALVAQARARAKMAHAQVETARAARDLAALDLSYTKILAPQDGVVSKKSVSVGQMLAAGQPVAQLVPAQDLWVTGNFKETQLGHMHTGQPATVEIDAFPGVELTGEVESFSAATGARFALLPPDNATGNFTKVVQRVPVRVRLREHPASVALRPGMSVELTVDTRK